MVSSVCLTILSSNAILTESTRIRKFLCFANIIIIFAVLVIEEFLFKGNTTIILIWEGIIILPAWQYQKYSEKERVMEQYSVGKVGATKKILSWYEARKQALETNDYCMEFIKNIDDMNSPEVISLFYFSLMRIRELEKKSYIIRLLEHFVLVCSLIFIYFFGKSISISYFQ